jgi:hypothetical protein
VTDAENRQFARLPLLTRQEVEIGMFELAWTAKVAEFPLVVVPVQSIGKVEVIREQRDEATDATVEPCPKPALTVEPFAVTPTLPLAQTSVHV